jgi:hypothetical protein
MGSKRQHFLFVVIEILVCHNLIVSGMGATP